MPGTTKRVVEQALDIGVDHLFPILKAGFVELVKPRLRPALLIRMSTDDQAADGVESADSTAIAHIQLQQMHGSKFAQFICQLFIAPAVEPPESLLHPLEQMPGTI